LLIAVMGMIFGCGSTVTPDNYAKIKEGQSEADVTDLLGKPSSTEIASLPTGSGSKDIWKDGDKTITVFVIGGKVVAIEKSGF